MNIQNNRDQLYINFDSGAYHIHHQFDNTRELPKYLCGNKAQEKIVFRPVERKHLRKEGINSRTNPLCRHCFNVMLESETI